MAQSQGDVARAGHAALVLRHRVERLALLVRVSLKAGQPQGGRDAPQIGNRVGKEGVFQTAFQPEIGFLILAPG